MKIILIGIAAMLVIVAILVIVDVSAWEKFRAEHHCKLVGKGRHHEAWFCDDSITYWR